MRLRFWWSRQQPTPPVSLEALSAEWRAILPLAHPQALPVDIPSTIPRALLNDLYPVTPEDVIERILAVFSNPGVLNQRERNAATASIHTFGDLYDVYQALQYLPDTSWGVGLQPLYGKIFDGMKGSVAAPINAARALTAVAFLTATTTAAGRVSLLATAATSERLIPTAQGTPDLEAQLVTNLATYTPLMHTLTAMTLKYERELPHVKTIIRPVRNRWYDRFLI